MTDEYPPNHPLHRATAADLDQLNALDLVLANAPGREAYAIRRVVDGDLGPITWVPWAEANARDDVIGYIIRKWHEAQAPEEAPPELTPEQRFTRAHRALEDAIAEYARLLAPDGIAPGLLVDWVLVTAEHTDLGGGQSMTTHNLGGPIDGATYKAVGLLQHGLDRLRQGITTTPPEA